jgi:hypothetical protein
LPPVDPLAAQQSTYRSRLACTRFLKFGEAAAQRAQVDVWSCTYFVVHMVNIAKVRIRMIDLCYLSEQVVGLYREKESMYPLSLQQGEVAKVNAYSDGERLHKQVSFDGRSGYTQTTYVAGVRSKSWTTSAVSCLVIDPSICPYVIGTSHDLAMIIEVLLCHMRVHNILLQRLLPWTIPCSSRTQRLQQPLLLLAD